MWSQGHIHTSDILGKCVSMVVIMSHVVGNALEWFPHVGHLASLSRLLYCCTCCTAVLVHQVQQICCTSTAVQPPRLGQRLLYCSTAVQLYLLYCCTCCTAVLPGLSFRKHRVSCAHQGGSTRFRSDKGPDAEHTSSRCPRAACPPRAHLTFMCPPHPSCRIGACI